MMELIALTHILKKSLFDLFGLGLINDSSKSPEIIAIMVNAIPYLKGIPIYFRGGGIYGTLTNFIDNRFWNTEIKF